MNETTDSHDWAQEPWWHGTVCPTGRFRWKDLKWSDRQRAGCIEGMVLQQLVTDTGGRRRRWVDIPRVGYGASDDE